MHALRSCKVQIGFVDGNHLHEWGQRIHFGANGAGGGLVAVKIGRHDDGIRTEFQRLEHRHGRPHTEEPRRVATGGDDTALASANNDGFALKGGIVALLNGREKGVAVDVCYG